MISYLEKFNNLSLELKDKISSPLAMAAISDIEKKYDIKLATIIMKIMVKEISILDLEKLFIFEYHLDGLKAKNIVSDLKKNVFFGLESYLGFSLDQKEITEKDKIKKWNEQKKQETSVRSSNFFFSSKDEEEVRHLANKLKNFGKNKVVEDKEKFIKIAKLVVKTLNLSFSSDNLRDRFENIIATYARGIRNKIDTKQTILKEVESGGLGFNKELTDNIINVSGDIINSSIKNEKEHEQKQNNEIKKNINKINIDKEKKELNNINDRDIAYDFNELKKQKDKKIENKNNKQKTLSLKELNLRKNNNEENKNIKKIKEVEKIKEKADIINPEIKLEIKSKINKSDQADIVKKRVQETEQGKVKMHDVKYVPKLTGPIEELEEMSLIDFRRLDSDPDIAIKKIIEKIKYLEDDGYDKRLAGIKAWRKSPLNLRYLRIGQESISAKQGINAIIDSKGEDNLTFKEFKSIMSLNKNLRF